MPDTFLAAMQQNKDRRVARRAPIVMRVECRTPRVLAQGTAENISETGMLIACREAFELSQTVTLRFALPTTPANSLAVTASAVVVRIERGRFMAVQFLGLGPAFRAAVAAYIERTARATAQPSLEVLPQKK